VLLDILMPEVTGIDVLENVRTFSRVPIVAFTADVNVLSLAMGKGADDYIAKPCDPDQLVKKIEEVLFASRNNIKKNKTTNRNISTASKTSFNLSAL